MTKVQKIWAIALLAIFVVGILIDGNLWGFPVSL